MGLSYFIWTYMIYIYIYNIYIYILGVCVCLMYENIS